LDAALPEHPTEILDAPGINATEILDALEHTPTRILDASRQDATEILDALEHTPTRILNASRQDATEILDARSRTIQAQTSPARSQILDAVDQTTSRAKLQSGNAQTILWQAAFLVGHLATAVPAGPDRPTRDKASLLKQLRQGVKIHKSELPDLPFYAHNVNNYSFKILIKKAEESHLKSHKQMDSWSIISAAN
jgi:hypothetical protein